MKTPDLTPCPFCGSKAGITHYQPCGWPEQWYCHCNNDQCRTQHVRRFETRDEAVAFWNHRVSEVAA